MANNLKRSGGDGKAVTANTPFSVHKTANNATDTGVGLMLTNVTTQDGAPRQIEVKAWLSFGTSNTTIYIADGWPIPAGGSIEAIEGKIVLQSNDEIMVQSDANNSLDALFSYLEQT